MPGKAGDCAWRGALWAICYTVEVKRSVGQSNQQNGGICSFVPGPVLRNVSLPAKCEVLGRAASSVSLLVLKEEEQHTF